MTGGPKGFGMLASLRRRPVSTEGRRWVAPLVALLSLVAIIAGAILVSSITRRQVHLDDGTVWVTSLKDRKAARFNVRLSEADVAVSSAAARFDVAQHDSDTMLTEGAKSTTILASTVSADATTETKGDAQAVVGGDSVAFLDAKSGNVWAGRTAQIDAISPSTAEPQMRLGSGGKVAVTADGTVWGLRPADGMVLKLDDPTGTRPKEAGSLSDGKAIAADDFTVVGGIPVAVADGAFRWKDGRVETGATDRLVLQSPSTDDEQTGWVAAAGKRGLYIADLSNGKGQATALESTGTGEAAKPVSTGGCVYAAWAQKARNYARACSAAGDDRDGSRAAFQTLQSVDATSDLVFRTNHRLVLLNDVVNGNVWNPADSTNVIKIQWNTIQTEQTDEQKSNDQSANNRRDFAKTCSANSGQIKAVDDQIGARAGGEQILDVLRNDEQTDCSVLRIVKVGAPSGADVTVSPVYDGRYLQLDASGTGAGQVSLSYDIADGRGQTSTATVSITLTGDDGNSAPTQSDTPPEYDVEQGATYTANALGGFTDPDGDPLTLVSAVPQNTDQVVVSTRADGQLVFNTGSAASGRVGVEVTVSDGQATGTGMVYFSIRPANTLAADIDAVVKQTTPGTDTTVELEPYVHGTSAQPAQLTSVEPPDKTNTTMNAADLSFTFKSDDPGTYYVPYTITQGSIPATGLARLEVQPAAGEAAKPVAANDVALLGADNTAIVEPLANDVDPMGGVLSVTSVSVDPSLGIKTGLVSHKRVYLTARQVPTEPVKVTYTVANAAGSAKGTIVLQPPALSAGNSSPKASNVNAQVRTGGIVSVDVLDHVSHADGTTVTLQHNLQTDGDTFKGLAFVSGDTVRYQAGSEPGVYTVTYTVNDDLGNSASGVITISVHARDAEGKPAPTPKDAQAQVAAGQKVRIPITLAGIDPDGDDDQLLGLGNKAPSLGRISEVGSDYLVYEAYADSSGTDVFSYAVEDWTGQRAQAQVRVGVFQGDSDSGVYARDDEITLRPNTAATVPVAQNDISGDNTDLTVGKDVEAQHIDGVSVEDNMIAFTTPGQAGTAYVIYTVSDKAGLSDTATLTINVDPDAPIEPPDAYDYRVPSAATIDKKSVDVDVSPWIANPSGTIKELEVGVDPSAASHAAVKGGKGSTTISVELTDEARSVPYTVTNTTYGITSTAFIQVPAYGVFPPSLRPKAPELKVNARETITINVADYVRVGAGKNPYVSSPDSVSATKAADGDLYVNDQTLRFTAPKDYAGPASITFTAQDSKPGSNDAKIVNSAVLTLPITVIGRDVPPPTFSSSTIDVVAGEDAKTIDLTALTHSSSGLYDDEKAYTYSSAGSSGQVEAQVSQSGQLTVSAPKDTTPGTVVSVPIAINYQNGTVNAGVTVRVVASNRALASVPGRSVRIKAGETQTVDLLSTAFNPFPETPLTMVGCASDDSAKLTVAGCSGSGSLSITAAGDIGASTNTVVVTVQDATRTRERQVTATITVSVADRPEAPLLSPVAGKPADGAVNLSWTPGTANGSPIDDYQVEWNDGGSKACGAVTTCQITGLDNGREYTFTVKAHNEVGWSKQSAPVTAKPDKVPDAPGDVRVEAGHLKAVVSWSAPSGGGSKPDEYTVTLTGPGGYAKSQTAQGLTATFDVPNEAIVDGATFGATVTARNWVGDGPASAPSGGAKVWGDPDPPTLSLTQNGESIDVAVTLGNLRNAGCSSVTLDGDVQGQLDCGKLTVSTGIDSNDYFRELHSTATLTTGKGQAVRSNDASVTPGYEVPAPTDVRFDCRDSRCSVSWRFSGKSDTMIVNTSVGSMTTTGYVTGGTTDGMTFDLQPWQTFSNVTVTARFKGHDSAAAQASGNPYTYKVPARIDMDDMTVTWDRTDTNVIVVQGGSVSTYGQNASVRIDLRPTTSNGTACSVAWNGLPDRSRLDVSQCKTGSKFTWSVHVADAGGASGIEASKDGGEVRGDRVNSGMVESSAFRGADGSWPRPPVPALTTPAASDTPAMTATSSATTTTTKENRNR